MLLYFILRIEVVHHLNLIWIRIGLQIIKGLEIKSVFYSSLWPWAKTRQSPETSTVGLPLLLPLRGPASDPVSH
jgi:hypothetical protein